MINKSAFIFIFSILSILLVACQGNDNGADADNGNNENDDSSSSDQIELTLWNIWTDEDAAAEAFKNRVEAFNENQDDIKIDLETTAHDQYKTKLKTQAAGNQLPELFQVWPGAELAPIAEGGLLEPIDSIKDNWDGMIPDNVMEDYAFEGEQYAIPATMSYTSIIYYDPDMLDEVGYSSFPESYDEFIALINDLNDNDITPIELGNNEQWILQSVYISTIADRLTGSDFLEEVTDGKAKFTDDEFVDALSIIEELTDEDAFNEDMNTLDEVESRDAFANDEAAMLFSGAWGTGLILDAISEDKNVSAAIFPDIPEGDGNPDYVSGVSSGGIGVNSDLSDEEKEAAFEFLEFLYSDELYEDLIKIDQMVPADIDFPDELDGLTKEVAEVTNDGISPVYDGVLGPEVISVMENGLQSITTGSSTPEDVAKEMQEEME